MQHASGNPLGWRFQKGDDHISTPSYTRFPLQHTIGTEHKNDPRYVKNKTKTHKNINTVFRVAYFNEGISYWPTLIQLGNRCRLSASYHRY